jgi:hypothetical protein
MSLLKIFIQWSLYTGLFISPSGISELDCATTETHTAETSISIVREPLQVFFVLGALAYFQVPPLEGSREEKWRSQWIKKRSMSWNLPKLSQLWLCNGGFGSCTTQNHLQTKQFVNGTWIPPSGGNWNYAKAPIQKKLGEILYLLICSFLPCLSWLLRSRFRKSRRDLWITLYTVCR